MSVSVDGSLCEFDFELFIIFSGLRIAHFVRIWPKSCTQFLHPSPGGSLNWHLAAALNWHGSGESDFLIKTKDNGVDACQSGEIQ